MGEIPAALAEHRAAVMHTPPPATSLSALLCAVENSASLPLQGNTDTPKHSGGHRNGGPSSLLGRALEVKPSHRAADDSPSDHRGQQASVPHPSLGTGLGLRHTVVRPASEQVATSSKITVMSCGTSEAGVVKNEARSEGPLPRSEGPLPRSEGPLPSVELAKLHRQTQQKAKKLEWLKRRESESHGNELGGGQENECVKENLISIGRCYSRR